jgi:hypothetical protein
VTTPPQNHGGLLWAAWQSSSVYHKKMKSNQLLLTCNLLHKQSLGLRRRLCCSIS